MASAPRQSGHKCYTRIPQLGDNPSISLGRRKQNNIKSLKALIDTLRLTVCLWVVGGAQLQHCTRELEQGLLEVTDKHWVSIRNDGCRQPMTLIHHVHEGCSN
jgi:hypothetical protein